MYNSKCGRKYWRYEDHKYSVVLSFWFQKWHIVTIATTHAYLDLKPRQRIMDEYNIKMDIYLGGVICVPADGQVFVLFLLLGLLQLIFL